MSTHCSTCSSPLSWQAAYPMTLTNYLTQNYTMQCLASQDNLKGVCTFCAESGGAPLLFAWRACVRSLSPLGLQGDHHPQTLPQTQVGKWKIPLPCAAVGYSSLART